MTGALLSVLLSLLERAPPGKQRQHTTDNPPEDQVRESARDSDQQSKRTRAGRLIRDTDGHGRAVEYVLDPAGNILSEETSEDGQIATRTFSYVAGQLRSYTEGGATHRFHYTPEGSLSCATTAVGVATDCLIPTGATAPASVLESYSYDYRDRLVSYRRFDAEIETDSAEYRYDPLDRLVEQSERHAGGLADRAIAFSYVGVTNVVGGETSTVGSETPVERRYAYDALGQRLSMTRIESGEPTERYTYGHTPHGSVSLLLSEGGTAKATYGYHAYGAMDDALTRGDSSVSDPMNAYRYSSKRLDSGSGTIDMGARRFSPETSRFLQFDHYNNALADLELGVDRLGGNRYALAAGNPIGYVEVDGHYVVGPDGENLRYAVPVAPADADGDDNHTGNTGGGGGHIGPNVNDPGNPGNPGAPSCAPFLACGDLPGGYGEQPAEEVWEDLFWFFLPTGVVTRLGTGIFKQTVGRLVARKGLAHALGAASSPAGVAGLIGVLTERAASLSFRTLIREPYLTPGQIEAFWRGYKAHGPDSWLAAMQFGKAVEQVVIRELQKVAPNRFLLNPKGPDIIDAFNPLVAFELTTTKQAHRKMMKYAKQGLRDVYMILYKPRFFMGR